MIQRDHVKELARDPVVLAEFLLNISTESLLALYADATVNESHLLDREEVFDAVLQRGDAGKKLVIARYAKLGGWFGPGKPEHLLALAQKSFAHKCALLANPRIDWYQPAGGFGEDAVINALVIPTLRANDAATEAFLANPRANRKLIATAIRGHAPFEGLTIIDRLRLGTRALRADCADSSRFIGKDASDANELNFDEPNRAFVAALRDYWDGTEGGGAESVAAEVFYELHERTRGVHTARQPERLAIEPNDWLSPADRAEVEAISDLTAREHRRRLVAGRRLAEWAVRIAAGSPSAPLESQRWYEFEGGLGNLAVLLALKGMRESNPFDNAPLHVAWTDSPTWVAQAAATAFAFEERVKREGNAEKREELAVQFLQEQSGRAVAAIRGLMVSAVFRGLAGSSEVVREALRRLANTSPEAERALSYIDYHFNGVFSGGLPDEEFEEAAAPEAPAGPVAKDKLAVDPAIETLATQTAALASRIQALQRTTFWGLLILAAIAYFS